MSLILEIVSQPSFIFALFPPHPQASPATVSRTGVVFLDYQDMGWRPYVISWLALKAKSQPKLKALLEDFAER